MKENKNQKVNSKAELKEVKKPKKKRSKSILLLFVALFGLTLSAAITIVNQNIAISEKKAELAALEAELQIVEIENDYLEEVKNYKGEDRDEYIENIAREDMDYIKNGERVFVNVSGN